MKDLIFILSFFFFSISLTGQDVNSAGNYNTDRFIDTNSNELVKIIVPGKPPDHFRMPPALPADAMTTPPDVPAYDWCFGCSATSAAMMTGYYDRTDYPAMYTGPTNSGVAPMNNSVWGTVIINGEVRSQCPFSATRQGLDGRTSRGHVDDYWIIYGNGGPDPFIANGWTEHTYGECTVDYMKTNQSTYGNVDGGTTFWYYSSGAPYSGNNNNNDGMYGVKLFFESRGYTVTNFFNQYIYGYNGNTLGFTFAQYKQEIDAGRPVLIQVAGHTMLGMGYNDAGSLVYLHDTWDYTTHEMTWGGSYEGMAHYGVGVIQMQPSVPLTRTLQNITITSGQSECYDATQTITVAGGGTTFTVQNGGEVTLIAGQNIFLLPGTMAHQGKYLLGAITANGNYCGSMQSAIVSATLPWEENNEPELRLPGSGFLIYPNPTGGRFTLYLDEPAGEIPCYFQVTGILGNMVINTRLEGNERFEFGLAGQSPGIYLVRLIRGEKVETAKLVKI